MHPDLLKKILYKNITYMGRDTTKGTLRRENQN